MIKMFNSATFNIEWEGELVGTFTVKNEDGAVSFILDEEGIFKGTFHLNEQEKAIVRRLLFD